MRPRLNKSTSRKNAKLVSSTTFAVRKDPTVLKRILSYTSKDEVRVTPNKQRKYDKLWANIQSETHLLTM